MLNVNIVALELVSLVEVKGSRFGFLEIISHPLSLSFSPAPLVTGLFFSLLNPVRVFSLDRF